MCKKPTFRKKVSEIFVRPFTAPDLARLAELTIETFGAGVGTSLCERAFARMREQGTGGDPFHAPARALYERLGCTAQPRRAVTRGLRP